MTNRRAMTRLETARDNLRRSLDFERSRLTDAEWRGVKAWLLRQLVERCFICHKLLDDDNSYGSDEFPLCRYHHGAVDFLAAFMGAGGTAEELARAMDGLREQVAEETTEEHKLSDEIGWGGLVP